MFDRSFLPPADLEFVVMTDTHYMLDPGGQRVEFESRRRQSARADRAWELVRALDTAFVVHLGDLVQEFPDGPGFEQSLGQALDQMERAGVEVRQVAGNHDVGDKPDPTMPTEWATAETLRAYHERFGPSWHSWDQADCHFVILNSQIMNGPLPEAEEQERWLEADLAAHAGMPTFVFLHLSPFLVSPDDPGLGHYDTIDQPARGRLLDAIGSCTAPMVFAGHSHFAFFNRLGTMRSYLVPSTAFTRPGFCEVFASAPPPERGRDDTGKLGFYLLRVIDGRARVQLIRTTVMKQPGQRIVTRTSADLPASPLGVTLRHPLSNSTEVPIAWQSTVRQPVRNDYPLLALVELGVRHARVPAQDLASAEQRERLAALRDEGAGVTAFWIWSPQVDLVGAAARHRDLLDGVEIQIPSALVPDAICAAAIAALRDQGVAVTLAPLLPKEIVPGKQHARTRIGYHLDELAALDRDLAALDVRVDRVLCRVDAGQDPWDAIGGEVPELTRIGAIDWAVEFADADDEGQTARAAAALLAVACHDDMRVFLEPLVDFDRTMDTPTGLLDRLCNPRPVFHAVRTLNTVLFGDPARWQRDGDGESRALRRGSERLEVALEETAGAALIAAHGGAGHGSSGALLDLETATSHEAGWQGVEAARGVAWYWREG